MIIIVQDSKRISHCVPYWFNVKRLLNNEAGGDSSSINMIYIFFFIESSFFPVSFISHTRDV